MAREKRKIFSDEGTLLIQGDYDRAIGLCDKAFGKYFEFCFCYVSELEKFRELDRFIWESRHCMRFQNEYTGEAVIDISDWNNREQYELNDYFDAFLFYLKSKREKIHCTFLTDGYCSQPLQEKIEEFFGNVRTVDLKPKETGRTNGQPIGFCASAERRDTDV
ncbi:MAG: hypothetical protein IJM02_04565 [Clostridia bacterium]|nr:hypothetical protein [Clostridia bacterium]